MPKKSQSENPVAEAGNRYQTLMRAAELSVERLLGSAKSVSELGSAEKLADKVMDQIKLSAQSGGVTGDIWDQLGRDFENKFHSELVGKIKTKQGEDVSGEDSNVVDKELRVLSAEGMEKLNKIEKVIDRAEKLFEIISGRGKKIKIPQTQINSVYDELVEVGNGLEELKGELDFDIYSNMVSRFDRVMREFELRKTTEAKASTSENRPELEAIESLNKAADEVLRKIEKGESKAQEAIVHLLTIKERCRVLVMGDSAGLLTDDQKAKLKEISEKIDIVIEKLRAEIARVPKIDDAAPGKEDFLNDMFPPISKSVTPPENVFPPPPPDITPPVPGSTLPTETVPPITSFSEPLPTTPPPENIPPIFPDPTPETDREKKTGHFEIPMFLMAEIFNEPERREQFRDFYRILFEGAVTKQLSGVELDNDAVMRAFIDLLNVEAGDRVMGQVKMFAKNAGVDVDDWQDVKKVIFDKSEEFLRIARLDVEERARAAILEEMPKEWGRIAGRTGVVFGAAFAASALTGVGLSHFECFKDGDNSLGRGAITGAVGGATRGVIQQFGFRTEKAEEKQALRNKETMAKVGQKIIDRVTAQIVRDDPRYYNTTSIDLATRFGVMYEIAGRDLDSRVAAEDEAVREILEKMDDESVVQFYEYKKLLTESGVEVDTAEGAQLAQLLMLTQAMTVEEIKEKVASSDSVVKKILDKVSGGILKAGEWLSGRSATAKNKMLSKVEGITKSSVLGSLLVMAFGAANGLADKTYLSVLQATVGGTFAAAGLYKFAEGKMDKEEVASTRWRFKQDFFTTKSGTRDTPAYTLGLISEFLSFPEELKVLNSNQLSGIIGDEKLKNVIHFWSAALRDVNRETKILLDDKIFRKQIEMFCNTFYRAESWLEMKNAEDARRLSSLLDLENKRVEEVSKSSVVLNKNRKWRDVLRVSTFAAGGAIGAVLGLTVGRYAPEILRKLGIVSGNSPASESVSPDNSNAGTETVAGDDVSPPIVPSGKTAALAGSMASSGTSGSSASELPVSAPRSSGLASEIVPSRTPVGSKLAEATLDHPPTSARTNLAAELAPAPEVRPPNFLDLNHPTAVEQHFGFTHKLNVTVDGYFKQLQENLPSLRNTDTMERLLEAAKFSKGRQAMFPELQGRNGINTADEAGGQFKLQVVDELMKQPGGVDEAAKFLTMQRFSGHGLSNMGIDQHSLPGTPGSSQYNDALTQKFKGILSGYSNMETHSGVVRKLFSGLQHNSSRELANQEIASIKPAKGEAAQFFGKNEFELRGEPVIGNAEGWRVGGHKVIPQMPTVEKIPEAVVPPKEIILPEGDMPRRVLPGYFTEEPTGVGEEMLKKISGNDLQANSVPRSGGSTGGLLGVENPATVRGSGMSSVSGHHDFGLTDRGTSVGHGDSVIDTTMHGHSDIAGNLKVGGGSVAENLAAIDSVIQQRGAPSLRGFVHDSPTGESTGSATPAETGTSANTVNVIENNTASHFVKAPPLAYEHDATTVSPPPPETPKTGNAVNTNEAVVSEVGTPETYVADLSKAVNSLDLGYRSILGRGDYAGLVRDLLHPKVDFLEKVLEEAGLSADDYFANGQLKSGSAEKLLNDVMGSNEVGMSRNEIDFVLGERGNADFVGVGDVFVRANVGLDNGTACFEIVSPEGTMNLAFDPDYKFFVENGVLYRLPTEGESAVSQFTEASADGALAPNGAEEVTRIKL
ncbi:MAG TPA: hypothetical protein PLV72_01120 [Candidatus Magasanikbacteria bacterium]|nr:hypothetical protein [Candidatus Magasanikbacteria bacterium]